MDEMKRINDAAEKVLAVCGQAEIGIILGSGLGDYAEALEDAVKLPYSEIPGFPRSTVAGHAGMWCCGTLHGKRVVMMQGRFHYYEGYSMKDVTLPVRVMQKIGVKTLIVTNAAGGVNVRPGPSTSGTPVASLNNGDEVQIVKSAGDGWYEITFKGPGGKDTSGYMKGDYLTNS